MTYLKTLITPLIALTTLALLTACAGGVTVNPTIVKTDDPKTTALCITNPFGTGCAVLTEPQAEAFCRDASKTTDTKAADCAPTVSRLCGENPFQTGFCPAPTPKQAEAFCGDASKTPDGKTTNCAPTVNRVCVENPFNTGLCFADNTYAPTRFQIRATCTSADEDLRNDLCPTIVAMTCTENPFLAECLVGDVGADTGTYGLARAKQITENCVGEGGTGFGNVFHRACNGIMDYEDERTRITNACTAETANTPSCRPNVVALVCNGNPYNTDLCFDDIDYSAKRAEELAECRRDNGRPSCVGAAAYEDTCTDNPFQENLCFIGTTYMPNRDTQTQNCRNKVADAPNCGDAQTAVCNADKFDAFCMGVALFIDAQRNECALATATTTECNMVFTGAFAVCLADPFSPACDAEPTFANNKATVRTSRFSFCKADQTNDDRCAGYRTCNDPMALALATCGAVFQPVRLMFCADPENAFDSACAAAGLENQTAQKTACESGDRMRGECTSTVTRICGPTGNPLNVFCADLVAYQPAQKTACESGNRERAECSETVVRICDAMDGFKDTFCHDITRYKERYDLFVMERDADPCMDGGCLEVADLPASILTTPTITYVQEDDGNGGMQDKMESDGNGGMRRIVANKFAHTVLRVTLNPLAGGTSLLNPDGTDKTTINPAPFNMGSITGVTVQEGATTFRRRGGPGSSDPDGFVSFSLIKANDDDSVTEASRASNHVAILPTTNLGVPLTNALTTLLWPGYYYAGTSEVPTDFYVTFEAGLPNNQIGRIGFANPAKNGIGTGDDRPAFASGFRNAILDVTFDANGILKGEFSNTSNFIFGAPVQGLIGTEGVVAVAIQSGSNTGGFIASNPFIGYVPPVIDCVIAPDGCFVTYEDWRGFSAPDSSGRSKERAILVSFSSNLNIENSPEQTLVNLATAQHNSVDLGGHAADGFNYVVIDNGVFVGVTDTTDLGAILAVQPIGTWNGAFVSIEDSTGTVTTTDFSLTVTFGGAGLGAGKSGSISSGTIGSTGYTFTGEFDTRGVIIGETMNATKGNGDLTGIIGAEGAVGVFLSKEGATTPHAGGFVARHIPATN